MSARVLVIVPTYNEKESIPGALSRLGEHVPDADVLVVDDGSPDGTGQLVEQIASDERDAGVARSVSVLHRTAKQGLGAAYVAGFGWALAAGTTSSSRWTPTGPTAPEELARAARGVARRRPRARLALGPRAAASSTGRGPVSSLSRGGNAYARLLLGIPVRDATGGFRAYRADLLRELALDDVASQGYCFQIDMALRVARRRRPRRRGADHLRRA